MALCAAVRPQLRRTRTLHSIVIVMEMEMQMAMEMVMVMMK
jgi:hypothetical protein